jgi:hypothetical protein
MIKTTTDKIFSRMDITLLNHRFVNLAFVAEMTRGLVSKRRGWQGLVVLDNNFGYRLTKLGG